MSVSLPPELLYNILAIVVVDYIDFATTLPSAEEKQHIEEFIASQHHELNASPDPLDDAEQTADLSINVLRRAQEDAKYTSAIDDDDDDDWYCEILDDSSDYYYNSDEKEIMCEKWDVEEAEDCLPENPVIPFLSASKHFCEVTLKVLSDALGTKEGENGSQIYQFRRLYRIAHTWKHPIFGRFPGIIEITKGLPLSPLLKAYTYICAIAYAQSRLLLDFFTRDEGDAVSFSQSIGPLMTVMGTIPQKLRIRVSDHACYRREAFYIVQILKEKVIDLRESCEALADLCYDSDQDVADCATEIGEVQRKLLNFHVAQQSLKKLDPSVQRTWIYTLEIPSVFQDIIGLSYEERGWNEHTDIITLRLIAKPLFLKWVRKSRVSPYIMFPQ